MEHAGSIYPLSQFRARPNLRRDSVPRVELDLRVLEDHLLDEELASPTAMLWVMGTTAMQ